MEHGATCRCALCRDAVTIEQRDRDLLAEEWEKGQGGRDREAVALRAGENGSPGSPRWIALQAIARARLAGIQAALARRALGEVAP